MFDLKYVIAAFIFVIYLCGLAVQTYLPERTQPLNSLPTKEA